MKRVFLLLRPSRVYSSRDLPPCIRRPPRPRAAELVEQHVQRLEGRRAPSHASCRVAPPYSARPSPRPLAPTPPPPSVKRPAPLSHAHGGVCAHANANGMQCTMARLCRWRRRTPAAARRPRACCTASARGPPGRTTTSATRAAAPSPSTTSLGLVT